MMRERQTPGNNAAIRATELAANTAARYLFLIGLVSLPMSEVTAAAPPRCDSGNPANWLSQPQMTERLTADGWMIKGIVSANGCWKISGTTPEGVRATGYFHPLSGQQLLIKSGA